MKSRHPSFGYGRISMQIFEAFGIFINRFAVHAGDCDGVAYCHMFNQIKSAHSTPNYLSLDNDPLFLFHRWKSNLRILEISERKSS
jgi:putative transposase